MTLKELKTKLASSDDLKRTGALKEFRDGEFGLEALPLLRQLLADESISLVLLAIECIGKLGPEALTCEAGESEMPTGCGKERASLEWQLYVLGGRVWGYSLYSNCYSACLKALVQLQADEDSVIEYINDHIGLCSPDDLVHSLNALETIGTPEARDLFKRSVTFWLPKLNKTYTKKVQALAATVK